MSLAKLSEGTAVWVVWYGRQIWGKIDMSIDEDEPWSLDNRYAVEFDKPEPCECGCGTDTPFELFPRRWIHFPDESATPEQLSTEGYGNGWRRKLILDIKL